jgi:hypothetical protein
MGRHIVASVPFLNLAVMISMSRGGENIVGLNPTFLTLVLTEYGA